MPRADSIPRGVRWSPDLVRSRRRWQTGLTGCISFAIVHETTRVHEIVNTGISMNMQPLSGAALERALAAKLEELLRAVDWLRGWQVEHVAGMPEAGFDLLATVPLPGGQGCVMRAMRRRVASERFPDAG
jgi:hypothetical protein